MKKYIILLFICIGMLTSCEEKGIMEYSDNSLYVSFEADATKDSVILSFRAYPTGVVTWKVPVKAVGVWARENREYTISIDEEMTTLPADLYELPEKCVFPAGQDRDTIEITLYNGSILAEKAYRLVLKIDENDKVKEGELNYRRAIFQVSDKLERPKWWTELNGGYGYANVYNIAETYYLGSYSEVKYSMFLEELAKDNIVFDGEDTAILKKYSLRLKYRVQDYNDDPANAGKPLSDENGNPIIIPVVG
ncbi:MULTISPECIES: DUF4843 domain-containing protein [Butyricimonas]|uniref:DUF4843 domain-containing protein n=1 Tax=Butyricimonas TaxID=574697 RepID=UPI0007FB57F9|nr:MULTISPECIES: DUF4843 domain-containing protein [Butyricimonas]